MASIEKYTGHIWEASDMKDLAIGDVFRVQPCDEPDCPGYRDDWYVVVSDPFQDEEGMWNAYSAKYPDDTRIH